MREMRQDVAGAKQAFGRFRGGPQVHLHEAADRPHDLA
jgi:hypothetical protein